MSGTLSSDIWFQVKEEMDQLKADAKVFKLIGPALVRQVRVLEVNVTFYNLKLLKMQSHFGLASKLGMFYNSS